MMRAAFRRACLAGLGAAALLGAALLAEAAAPARAPASDACLAAADRAARRHAVPPGILRAIALAESGTRRGGGTGPWPWTLNVAGQGMFFDTPDEALEVARQALARGVRSIDLGCFQINHRWHGAGFGSLEAMLDPDAGADYAARFLRGLFEESGNWLVASGHYHSRTARHADRYRAQIETLLDRAGPMRREPAGQHAAVPERPGDGVRVALAREAGPRRAAPPPGAGALPGFVPRGDAAMRPFVGLGANAPVPPHQAGAAGHARAAGSLFALAARPEASGAAAPRPLIGATAQPLIASGS